MKLIGQLALASASITALAAPAYAQDTATNTSADQQAASDDSGDIIVTARRRDESKQDVPLVVNAVSGQSLNNLNIHNFKDITQVVPGLSLVPNANGIGSASSLRGVNHDVNVSGNNGTIQYYLDDAPVGSDTVFQAMYDVNDVEVLRGPQGTLRGRATPSGSITVSTRQPDLSEPGVVVDGTVGTHAAGNLQFGIGVPIIKDKLAIRVAGLYDSNRGNDVTSVNNSTLPRNNTRSLRATVRFEPTDWLKAGFTYTTLKHEFTSFDQAQSFNLVDSTVGFTAGAPNYGTISLADRKSVSFQPFETKQKFQRYNWHAQADFMGQSLIYVGSHQTTTYDGTGPNDPGGYFPNLTNLAHSLVTSIDDSHEIRLQNQERVAGIFDYVVGYFQYSNKPTTALTTGALVGLYTNAVVPGLGTIVVPLPAAFVPGGQNPFVTPTAISLPTSQTKEQSFFGNLTAHIGEKLEVSGGLRQIKYRDAGQNLFVNGNLTSPAQPNDFDKLIYNATVRYRFSPDLMVYASTGSSIRPGAHAIGDFSTLYSTNEQLYTHTVPETSKSYEIGFKSSWLDHRVTFNATYYHQNFNNYPLRAAGNGVYYLNFQDPAAPPTVSSFNFISGVPVKVDGVEAELDFRPSEHFYLNSTLNYSKSKVGNATVACNLVAGVPTVAQLQAAFAAAGYPGEHLGVCSGGGQAANFDPNWSGTVIGEYSMEVSNRVEGFVRGLVAWRGSTANDPNNPYDSIGAYALINAYLGARAANGSWALTLYGKNLGNVTRLSTLNGAPYNISQNNVNVTPGAAAIPSTNFISRYGAVTVTAPREFGINLRVAFGSR